MKSWKKSLIPAALALAIAVPAAAFAADTTTTTTDPAAQTQLQQPFNQGGRGGSPGFSGMEHRGGMSFGQNSVHQSMYLSLLAQKYEPASQDEWESALAERSSLQEQLKAVLPSRENRKDDREGGQALTDEQKTEMKQQMEQKRQQADDLKTQLESGAITQEEYDAQLKELGLVGGKPGHDRGGFGGDSQGQPGQAADGTQAVNGDTADIDAQKALQEQFNAAIESGDATQIAAVLPQLLDEIKKENTQLAQKIEALKNASDASGADATVTE
ncbi:hypothetical protein [Paenibacillus sp. y28]|uniref:hypothetical protein n=1 Tax=Paenibacillus sp. y28 TaxID=3129110 RepID=UPI003019DEAF